MRRYEIIATIRANGQNKSKWGSTCGSWGLYVYMSPSSIVLDKELDAINEKLPLGMPNGSDFV